MPRVHAIRTGRVRVRRAQRKRRGGGLSRVLLDREWTAWLPIHAWAIEHPDGAIVVDTGETARATEPGYFPRWHPYYRFAVRMDLEPEDEIGPQLRSIGLSPEDVRTVVLTHLHTDHAGGLHHFPKSDILVDADEWSMARGWPGRLRGYLPHRWPAWFAPRPIRFEDRAVGPFARSAPLTDSGDVSVVPTPGHTPHHVSVIVRDDEGLLFLAGDTSYDQALLAARHPDGVSPDPAVTRKTIDRILELARRTPTVYLPSHDPESAERLRNRSVLDRSVEAAAVAA